MARPSAFWLRGDCFSKATGWLGGSAASRTDTLILYEQIGGTRIRAGMRVETTGRHHLVLLAGRDIGRPPGTPVSGTVGEGFCLFPLSWRAE